jgi:hypothetical protein
LIQSTASFRPTACNLYVLHVLRFESCCVTKWSLRNFSATQRVVLYLRRLMRLYASCTGILILLQQPSETSQFRGPRFTSRGSRDESSFRAFCSLEILVDRYLQGCGQLVDAFLVWCDCCCIANRGVKLFACTRSFGFLWHHGSSSRY